MGMNEKRKAFRKRIEEKQIIIAPGIYDAFTAKLAEHVGFEALYITGAGIAAGLLGVPDIGLVTMTEQLEQARRIVGATDLPVICDADTGYGNPLNVLRTVKEFEKAGICAIHLEDQVMPKKCGHLDGKKVIPTEEMVNKLKAALDARVDSNFLIIARTDARAIYGIQDAIERGQRFAEIGVDMIFIEAPESVNELITIGKSLTLVPLLVNRGGGGKTPGLSAEELGALGFRIVIFPGDAQKAAGKAVLKVLGTLKERGNVDTVQDMMMTFEERFETLGLAHFRKLEQLYAEKL
jgi:2-methylisocitrate lyase-like PEP mutase family enzyme